MKKHQRLADALTRVRQVTDTRGAEVVRSSELRRQDRELLVASGWLQEITRGWYLLVRPDIAPGDSGPWYSHFWEFLRCYLEQRFAGDYCLSAESSLLLHTGYSLIPPQVVAVVKKGGGNPVRLPFNTSLLAYAAPDKLPANAERVRGLYVMPLPLALCRISPAFFTEKPTEVQLALRMIRDPSEISQLLIKERHQRAAGRLVGAYQAIGQVAIADHLHREMEAANIPLFKIDNPFGTTLSEVHLSRSPYAARIEATWTCLRRQVEQHFPIPPGLPKDAAICLQQLEGLYQYDAYHSLSIEGYEVSPELVEKVRNNHWSPEVSEEDHKTHQALAARGYYEAFGRVKETIAGILRGDNPARKVLQDLQEWYRALWAPQVRANILKPHHVVGYRRNPVYIRGSRHTPPPREALLDAMDALFLCMQKETHPAVRAVLGHYLFVFIHPYPDGNGRIARFLMNTMLVSGGYPWTVIRVEDRRSYFEALETTHVSNDISRFAQFVNQQMERMQG